MAEPIDTISVEINARLDALQAQMNQAQRIVDQGVGRMQRSTQERGLFGFGGLTGGAARALGTFQLVRSAMAGLETAAKSDADAFDRSIEGASAFADTLTFGLHKSLIDTIVGFTGLEQAAKRADDRLKEMQRDLSIANRARAAELALGVAMAQTPQAKALAELTARRAEIDIEAQGLPAGGRSARLIAAERRTAEREAIRSAYGNIQFTESQIPQLLQSIGAAPQATGASRAGATPAGASNYAGMFDTLSTFHPMGWSQWALGYRLLSKIAGNTS